MSMLAKLRQWFSGTKAEFDAVAADQDIAAIEHNVTAVCEQVSRLVGHDLPPGRAGVEFLDGFIERHRAQWDDDTKTRLAQMAGCYVGAALIAEYGGRWIRDGSLDGGLGVEVVPQLVCFPLAKAHKHVFYGPGDSVLAFFNSVPALLNVPDDPPTEGYRAHSAERLAAIERAVQAAMAELVPEYPPGRAGVELLDALIERRRGNQDAEADAKLATSAGHYFGASVIAAGGGRWINFSDEHDVAIELARGGVIFPIELAAEHLSEGSARSLLLRFNRFTTP